MLVTLPFLFLLLDYWPLGRFTVASGSGVRGLWPVVRRLGIEKIPLFVLSAASCTITLIAQSRGGAVVPITQLPFATRVGNALAAYWETPAEGGRP